MEGKDVVIPRSSESNSESESPPPVCTTGGGIPPAPAPPPPVMNIPADSNISERTQVTGGGEVIGGSVDSLGKKKRGRPRKYDADGNLRAAFYTSSPKSAPPPPGLSDFSSKKARGRPPGSGNWQLPASLGELFANTAGGDFVPHVVTVTTGEDVAGKILSFSEKGPRGICVLSANGAVSNVTIHQPGSHGGILTYEGRFEILSLTGSYTVSENDGVKRRSGGLSVSLAGPDGRVIGGGIAGLLVAASPIQIVVGSFLPNGYLTHKRKHQNGPGTTTTQGISDTVTAATPISQAAPDANIHFTPMSQSPVQNHGSVAENIIADTENPISSTDSEKPTENHHPDVNDSLPVE